MFLLLENQIYKTNKKEFQLGGGWILCCITVGLFLSRIRFFASRLSLSWRFSLTRSSNCNLNLSIFPLSSELNFGNLESDR